jgi:hypothetical protein
VRPIIEAVLGKPAAADAPRPSEDQRLRYTYKESVASRPTEAVLTVEGRPYAKKAGPGGTDTLHYVGNDTFRSGGTLYSFERANGKPARVRMDGGYGYYILKKS